MTSTRLSLEAALTFLSQYVSWRMDQVFGQNGQVHAQPPAAPVWEELDGPLAQYLHEKGLGEAEQLLLLIALAPHLRPDFFDQAISARLPQAGEYPQVGGWRGKYHRGLLPTGETALFLLAGPAFDARLQVQQFLSAEHLFAREEVLHLEAAEPGEPPMSGKLVISQDFVDWFVQGQFTRPRFSMQFPAQLIETQLEWADLVLNPQTQAQIRDLEAWLKHGPTILGAWGMGRKLKPGYRALFYGPPGTGKTLTASLLGKYTGKDVYKVDLSMVVSKFIGETEKNLANLFARAERKDWILFFDEADALFGKRTNVRDAHDKYANQEVSYLLQRVETYDGLVILASNFKSNIDEAFIRRFQAIIHFPMPSATERERLWAQAFPPLLRLAPELNLGEVARSFELTGADIMNVVQQCCLQALQVAEEGQAATLDAGILLRSIRREFAKSGRLV